MTAKFARLPILKTLPLQEYERWLRLAGEHREWFDNLQLRKYLIDDNEAYLIDSRPVIERNGSGSRTPDEEAAAPIDEAHDASVEVHAPREAGLDAREMRAVAWLIIVMIAGGYFIFGAPIKDQLASWGFSMIVVYLIWPWLGPWLHRFKDD